jgi:proline iminopeptidase
MAGYRPQDGNPFPKTLSVNGVEIAFEWLGRQDDPVVCLIQGLGMTLNAWPPMMVRHFLEQGFSVLSFDNRDIGRSQLPTKTDVPDIQALGLRKMAGLPLSVPYGLADMMKDTLGLFQALSIAQAHVLGMSMGGMIAQMLAIEAPASVISLTCVMSTSGRADLPGPRRDVAAHLFSRPASKSRADRLAFSLETWRLIGSSAYPRSEAEMKQFILRNMERGVTGPGIARQTAAIMAASDRTEQLRLLDVPSLVVHGKEDVLVPVACGVDIARSIPGSDLLLVPGMGHDLPVELLGGILDRIVAHFRASDPDRQGSRA